jgi:TolB-like protein
MPTSSEAARETAVVRQPVTTPPVRSAQSIAVLPFVVMSTGVDDNYFADGLTEEILNSLAQLPELLVTARTSAFSFKGRDLPVQEIAETLGVRHVVEGSVRRSGDRLRVTAQLIRADDGFHLWSKNYDSTSEDTIAVQEDIAEKIAVALDVVMNEEKRAAMRQAGLRDVEAFVDFQKGLEWYYKAHGEVEQIGGLRQANQILERVLERVPGYPPALSLHSDLYIHMLLNDATGQPMVGVTDEDLAQALTRASEDYATAIQHARSGEERKNLEFDQAFLTNNWRFLPSMMERLVSAQGCNDAVWGGPVSSVFGQAQRFLQRANEVRKCDPLVSTAWLSETRGGLWAGDPAQAASVGQQGMEIAPGEWLRLAMIMALVADGQFDEAEKEISTRAKTEETIFLGNTLVAAARGDRPAAQAVYDEYFSTNPTNDYWTFLAESWMGNREKVNRLAAKVDQHPFGNVSLVLLTYWCACGSPWELEATPNFARILEESGLPWPPASSARLPLKDW